MSIDDVALAFKENGEEFLEFDSIENPSSKVRDLCGFMLLEKLGVIDGRNIVSSSEHDEIFLNVDLEELKEVATVEDIITLCRCGILYSNEYDCLYMFT